MEHLFAQLFGKASLHLLTASGRGGGNSNEGIWVSLHGLLDQRHRRDEFTYTDRMKPDAALLSVDAFRSFKETKALPPALSIGWCLACADKHAQHNERGQYA